MIHISRTYAELISECLTASGFDEEAKAIDSCKFASPEWDMVEIGDAEFPLGKIIPSLEAEADRLDDEAGANERDATRVSESSFAHLALSEKAYVLRRRERKIRELLSKLR